jgi:hypothetical protein
VFIVNGQNNIIHTKNPPISTKATISTLENHDIFDPHGYDVSNVGFGLQCASPWHDIDGFDSTMTNSFDRSKILSKKTENRIS